VLRICRVRDIKSTIKYANLGCTRQAKEPQYLAENLLNRQFCAERPNEKWLTDVTEFKWYEGIETHKVYLSAILDLCDRRIVAYVIGERNDNPLVFKTFDKALKANPGAHPLFHSDRGFQYTNRTFHHKLTEAGMTQSMSRVAHCIDNGPMEGFWGILNGPDTDDFHIRIRVLQLYESLLSDGLLRNPLVHPERNYLLPALCIHDGRVRHCVQE
jgi:transposase InsO family protein